jgi:hypothetical protein
MMSSLLRREEEVTVHRGRHDALAEQLKKEDDEENRKRIMLAIPAPPRPLTDAPVVVHTNTRHARCPPGLITPTGLMCSRKERCRVVGGCRLSSPLPGPV